MDEPSIVSVVSESFEYSRIIQKAMFARWAVMQYGQSFHSTRMTIMNTTDMITPSRAMSTRLAGTFGQQAVQAIIMEMKNVKPTYEVGQPVPGTLPKKPRERSPQALCSPQPGSDTPATPISFMRRRHEAPAATIRNTSPKNQRIPSALCESCCIMPFIDSVHPCDVR